MEFGDLRLIDGGPDQTPLAGSEERIAASSMEPSEQGHSFKDF
jgi:hypothetical protein